MHGSGEGLEVGVCQMACELLRAIGSEGEV